MACGTGERFGSPDSGNQPFPRIREEGITVMVIPSAQRTAAAVKKLEIRRG
jgi:hypothetical protein